MARRKPLGKRIVANLKAKWFQVMVSFVLLCAVITGAHKVLLKKSPASEAEKAKEQDEFKYMHCDKCQFEKPYNKELAEKKVAACKCKQGESGYWTPTKKKILEGGDDKYVWFNTTVFVSIIVWLGILYLLLARNDVVPDFYFVKCLHCQEMLRYTAHGFDLLVACPKCEQLLRLPSEEEAMSWEDHEEEKTATTLTQYEKRLRDSGYLLPGDEPPKEPDPDADPSAEAGLPPQG